MHDNPPLIFQYKEIDKSRAITHFKIKFTLPYESVKNKGTDQADDGQAGLSLCWLHVAKSDFLATSVCTSWAFVNQRPMEFSIKLHTISPGWPTVYI